MGYYTPQMITEKQYERIIACLKCGYLEHRPNLRIATILQITFNTGMNTEDIINMKPVAYCGIDRTVLRSKTDAERS